MITPIPAHPVSWAVVTTAAADEEANVLVRSKHEADLLDAKLSPTGSPVTEQDGRTAL